MPRFLRHTLALASLALCLLCLPPGSASASTPPAFPALTGRVVDDAHLLGAQDHDALDAEIRHFEEETSHQFVIVTLPSLQGRSIEDFSYQLLRHWGIGHKGKDDGVLFVIAPAERKARIEVGYGLEGTLTDAMSSLILHDEVLPAFAAHHAVDGIQAGASAIIHALGGSAAPGSTAYERHLAPEQSSGADSWIGWIFVIIFLIFFIRHPFLTIFMLFDPFARVGGERMGGSGGFMGGGGSSGGGGASGSW